MFGVMKLSKVNIFEDDLMDAKEWEEQLRPKIKEMFVVKALNRVSYSENPEAQRRGLDYVLKKEDPSSFQLKVRDNYAYERFGDILLEVKHSYGKKGWFYKYYENDIDLVFYVWKNKSETNLIKPGYILRFCDKLMKWFEENKKKYKKVPAKTETKSGKGWKTWNRGVPPNDFPKGTLFPFDPRLSSDQQRNLEKYLNGEV